MPEIEIRKIGYEYNAHPYTVFRLHEGELINGSNEGVNSGEFYLCLDQRAYEDRDKNVRCFRITPDMIFKVYHNESGTIVADGQYLMLSSDSGNNGLEHFTGKNLTVRDAVIVSAAEYNTNHIIYIRFVNERNLPTE